MRVAHLIEVHLNASEDFLNKPALSVCFHVEFMGMEEFTSERKKRD